VKAVTDCHLLYLDKETFIRLTQPFADIFFKNEKRYGEHWDPNNATLNYISTTN